MKKTLLWIGALILLLIPTVALAEAGDATPTPVPATATPAPSARPRTTLSPEEKALREEIAADRQMWVRLMDETPTARGKPISRLFGSVENFV